MRFDRTDGKKAKYMVNVYEGNTEDHYYFHYYKDADKFFVGLRKVPHESGTCINIYDLQKDERKEFYKFK